MSKRVKIHSVMMNVEESCNIITALSMSHERAYADPEVTKDFIKRHWELDIESEDYDHVNLFVNFSLKDQILYIYAFPVDADGNFIESYKNPVFDKKVLLPQSLGHKEWKYYLDEKIGGNISVYKRPKDVFESVKADEDHSNVHDLLAARLRKKLDRLGIKETLQDGLSDGTLITDIDCERKLISTFLEAQVLYQNPELMKNAIMGRLGKLSR